MVDVAYFESDGDGLRATPMACSGWSAQQMHGIAVSGALARGLERRLHDLGGSALRASRYTVDLFRPARMSVPCRVETTVVREGNRLVLLDAVLLQEGEPAARASGLFLRPGDQPAGRAWRPDLEISPPPVEVAPPGQGLHVPYFRSDLDWSQDFAAHQNAGRKATWQTAVPVVAGEALSGFVAVASTADATSMVTHWGTNGVEYINTDISMVLAREPDGVEIGLLALDRVEAGDGIAAGTAVLFDRSGRFGTAMVSAMANARRTVDLARQDFSARNPA